MLLGSQSQNSTAVTFTNLLLKCCAHCLCVALFFCFTEHVIRRLPQNFHSPTDWSSFAASLIPLSLLLLYVFLLLKRRKSRPLLDLQLRSSVWNDISSTAPWLCLARKAWYVVLSILSFVAILYSLFMSADRGIVSLAFLADDLGFYPTAERLYSLSPERTPAWSLARLRGHNFVEYNTTWINSEYSNAIIKNYGMFSPETAHHYMQLACACSHRGQDAEACRYYRQSLNIHQIIGDRAGMALDLAHLLSEQLCAEKPDTALLHSLANEALSLLTPDFICAFTNTHEGNSTGLAFMWLDGSATCYRLSPCSGLDEAWCSELKKREPLYYAAQRRTAKIDADLTALITALLVGAALVVYVGAPVAEGVVFNNLNKRWRHSLNEHTSIDVQTEQLGKLIRLELCQGNMAAAESYSIRSLELAEKLLCTRPDSAPVTVNSGFRIRIDPLKTVGTLILVLVFCIC